MFHRHRKDSSVALISLCLSSTKTSRRNSILLVFAAFIHVTFTKCATSPVAGVKLQDIQYGSLGIHTEWIYEANESRHIKSWYENGKFGQSGKYVNRICDTRWKNFDREERNCAKSECDLIFVSEGNPPIWKTDYNTCKYPEDYSNARKAYEAQVETAKRKIAEVAPKCSQQNIESCISLLKLQQMAKDPKAAHDTFDQICRLKGITCNAKIYDKGTEPKDTEPSDTSLLFRSVIPNSTLSIHTTQFLYLEIRK